MKSTSSNINLIYQAISVDEWFILCCGRVHEINVIINTHLHLMLLIYVTRQELTEIVWMAFSVDLMTFDVFRHVHKMLQNWFYVYVYKMHIFNRDIMKEWYHHNNLTILRLMPRPFTFHVPRTVLFTQQQSVECDYTQKKNCSKEPSPYLYRDILLFLQFYSECIASALWCHIRRIYLFPEFLFTDFISQLVSSFT